MRDGGRGWVTYWPGDKAVELVRERNIKEDGRGRLIEECDVCGYNGYQFSGYKE